MPLVIQGSVPLLLSFNLIFFSGQIVLTFAIRQSWNNVKASLQLSDDSFSCEFSWANLSLIDLILSSVMDLV